MPPLVWRSFVTTASARGSIVCGAAIQREGSRGALIVHACESQPTTPGRRFGLGYDRYRLALTYPTGDGFTYDLVRFIPMGPYAATAIAEGPVSGTLSPRDGHVRDTTDIVIVLDSAVPAGLPTLTVDLVVGGRETVEAHQFEPLAGPAGDTRLERLHEASAPTWATKPAVP